MERLLAIVFVFMGTSSLLATASFKKEGPVSVMTFNIRYDNPADKPNDWPSRRDWVGELIAFYAPDFVGTQEALHNQVMDMQQRMSEFAFIGVGRDEGKQSGEYCALFYRKDRYEVVRSSTFWLSETPEYPSKGWDAALNRIVTWGEFKSRATGKTFFVFNTHFDHRGIKAREESAKLLVAKVNEIAGNRNAIIMGDFNSDPNSRAYSALTNGTGKLKGFMDVFKLAEKPYGPEWTFNSFGMTPIEDRKRIDYIFVNKKAKVEKYVSISEQRGNIFPSDHLPVMAVIDFG